MNLKAILNYLDAQGVGDKGRDLFRHKMPARVTSGVLLIEPLTGTMIDHEVKGHLKGNFSAIIRHTRLSDAEALAQTVYDTLTLVEVLVDTDMHVKQCLPVHEPVAFPRTEGDFVEISVTFGCIYFNPS